MLEGRIGSLDAPLRDGRRGEDLDVGEIPLASVVVFGLLILLANDAPLLACGGLEIGFECWVVDELERLVEGIAAFAPAGDRVGI